VGRFFNPYGIAVRPNGALLVSDTYNGTLREVLAPFSQWIARTGGGAVLSWESVIGVQYEVLARNGLDQPWSLLTPGNGASAVISSTPIPGLGAGSGPIFYQVRRQE